MTLDAAAVADLLAAAEERSGRRSRTTGTPRNALVRAVEALVIAAGTDGVRMRDVAVKLGRETRRVSMPLTRLVEAGRIQRVARGLYVARKGGAT